MPRTEIYEKFLSIAKLSDTARAKLQTKRGFTNETIKTLRLVSGNPLYVKALQELRAEYGDELMKEAGLFTLQEGKLVEAWQLLDKDRVIIPYLDDNGQAYLLRPHKKGLCGVQIEPYCFFLLKNRPEDIVLTEGEFKAAALYQWGIPGIAIPGIQSFSGKHFSRLVELLKDYRIKNITIIFDNEVKDNPEYPNFKEHPAKRYDTDYWAYIMAYKLGREGFITKIGKLPDEWRQEGKIDFDGALAQGRTREDILRVIGQAQTIDEYRRSWSGESRQILERKIKKFFMSAKINPPIKRGDEPGKYNCYLASRPSKMQAGAVDYEQISNFVITIETSFHTPDGIIREVTFTNEFGEKSDRFLLLPEDMVSSQLFAKFCASKGNYLWYGKQSDLVKVWELEMTREDTGVIVYQPDKVGEVEPGLWLFANVAVKNGKVYKPDERGIFWIEGKGYLPRPLTEVDESDPIPELHLEGSLEKIREIAKKLKENIGYAAYAGLGWVIACIFSRVIFEAFGFFPILFIHGRYESGKTTFTRWLFNFLGIETNGRSIAESTQNFIMRTLAYYSSLASWFDEYRNEAKITAKNGYLRSAYNRQSAGKGIKAAFGAKGYEVNGALAISGEESPRDAGLASRCCFVRLSEAKRTGAHYAWLNAVSPEFSWLTYFLICNYEALKEKILKNIKDLNEALKKSGVPDRTAGNWAIVGGAFYTVIFEDDNFIRWIREECQVTESMTKAEHMLAVFWEEVNVLCSRGILGGDYFRAHVPYRGKPYFGFWFSAVYEAFAKNYKQTTGREPFNKASILQYLKDEEYFVADQVPAWLGKATKRLTLVDPAHPKLDKNLREILEYIENSEKRDIHRMDFGQAEEVTDTSC